MQEHRTVKTEPDGWGNYMATTGEFPVAAVTRDLRRDTGFGADFVNGF
jgi:hypothetical protein